MTEFTINRLPDSSIGLAQKANTPTIRLSDIYERNRNAYSVWTDKSSIRGRVNGRAAGDTRDNCRKRIRGRDFILCSVSRGRWFAVTKAQDLDEWSLVGLTRKQGLAKWSTAFADTSRMTLTTSWGWVAWEAGDPERAHVMRMASRVPPPVLVEIAVRDPESHAGRSSVHPARDAVTTCAWSGLAGLAVGTAIGVWWWGIVWPALTVAVVTAATAAVIAAVRRSSLCGSQPVRIVTADDAGVADVYTAAKILTWTTDHIRIHETATARPHGASRAPLEWPEEFREAVLQLHRALWTLANNKAGDARATLNAMTEYADQVRQLIDARERVTRASTVRVAPPAPSTRAKEPAAQRLQQAGSRLHDVIISQRDAATVIDDINRRYDETG
jgi:hypothetical protein